MDGGVPSDGGIGGQDAADESPPAPLDAGEAGRGCSLMAGSRLTNPTFTLVSGAGAGAPADCPSTGGIGLANIARVACTITQTGTCAGTMTCSLTTDPPDGDDQSFQGTASFTAQGSTATAASMSLTGSAGANALMCVVAVNGTLTATSGTMACGLTCVNAEPLDEMGCNSCLMTSCPNEYAACMADVAGGGCLTCGELLQASGATGVACDQTQGLVTRLLACACTSSTCD